MTTMTEVGALLRRERERKGLSHEDIARMIKVATRTLVALENGNIHDLPHVVYTKGFVKSYARIVDLNPEELGQAVEALFAEEFGEPDDTEIFITHRTMPKRSRWALPTCLLLILLLAAGGVWYYLYGFSADPMRAVTSGNMSEPATGVAPETVGSGELAVHPDDSTVPSPPAMEQGVTGGNAEPDPANAPVSAGPDGADSTAVATAPSSSEPALPSDQDSSATPQNMVEAGGSSSGGTEGVAFVPALPSASLASSADSISETASVPHASFSQDVALDSRSSRHRLQLAATAECWVEAWGEKVERKEMYLRPGQQFVLQFPSELTLRLGNSGGVRVTLDGKPLAIDGAEGRVLTVHFARR